MLVCTRAGIAAAVCSILAAGAASAATISAVDADQTVRGEITCSAACVGLFGYDDPELSETFASIYDQPQGGQNPAATTDFLNNLAGTEFEAGVRTDVGNISGATDEDATFSTSALWVALKLGNNYAFVKNTSGAELTIDWQKIGSGGFGLSNITEIGEAAPGEPEVVPLPAAAWLLMAGIGGLGLVARRRS